MGKPLSPLFVQIIIDNLEKLILWPHLINEFIYWYRYVEDIIVCFAGTSRQLKTSKNTPPPYI